MTKTLIYEVPLESPGSNSFLEIQGPVVLGIPVHPVNPQQISVSPESLDVEDCLVNLHLPMPLLCCSVDSPFTFTLLPSQQRCEKAFAFTLTYLTGVCKLLLPVTDSDRGL